MDAQQHRVRRHSAESVNRKLDLEAAERIEHLRVRGSAAINRRLWELETEWDIDRALMAFAGVAQAITLELALRSNRKWLNLLRAQFGFLVLHAVVGWCPPVSLLRRLGFRTTEEIERERDALRSYLRTATARTMSAQAAPIS